MRLTHPLFRSVAVILSSALLNASVPLGLLSYVPIYVRPLSVPKVEKMAESKLLRLADMKKRLGKTGPSPYMQGQQKWDVMYKGVDTFTGNYTLSCTDLDFQ